MQLKQVCKVLQKTSFRNVAAHQHLTSYHKIMKRKGQLKGCEKQKKSANQHFLPFEEPCHMDKISFSYADVYILYK